MIPMPKGAVKLAEDVGLLIATVGEVFRNMRIN